MAPGLALFYGGMVRSKSVLNMMMMTFGSLAVDHRRVGARRLLAGLRRRPRAGLLGDPRQYAGLGQLIAASRHTGTSTVPVILFAVFQ